MKDYKPFPMARSAINKCRVILNSMFGKKIYILLLLFFTSACSSTTVTTEGGDLTRVEVEYISRSLAEVIEKKFPLLKHKFVNRYMDSLGQQIISRNPDMPPLPYEFRILKTDEAGVFSLPSGIIYVTLGMLKHTDSESQLIAAITHELSHHQLGHILQTWRSKVNASRGKKLPLPEQLNWEDHFIREQGLLRLSEGMEKEADQLSPVILYRAGYDPRLQNIYLQWLQKMEQQHPALLTSLRALHPATAERIIWSKESVLRIPPAREARQAAGPIYFEIKKMISEAQKKKRAPQAFKDEL